jgi:hypothetical protein
MSTDRERAQREACKAMERRPPVESESATKALTRYLSAQLRQVLAPPGKSRSKRDAG